MIIYKNQNDMKSTDQCLARMEATVHRLGTGEAVRYEDAVDLLIGFGVFETAVSDSLCRQTRYRRIYPLLRRFGNLTGHVFCCSWENSGPIRLWVQFIQKEFNRLADLPLPAVLPFGAAEDCAYYNLYPETCLEASRKFYREVRPEHVVCIGLRSIGTSLSSVVFAMLENLGCKVASFTVRPTGDPGRCRVEFGGELGDSLRDLIDPFFVLVDEGPGKSGSSLCSAAQELSNMGIADDRIIFMPGCRTDGLSFVSESARLRWRRHRVYAVDFDEVRLRNRRLTRDFTKGSLEDMSAGQRRSFFSMTNAAALPYGFGISGENSSCARGVCR